MPTFDFHCPSCNHLFEFNRPFGSKEIPPCPKCDNTETEKQIAKPAIHFKGEGFYVTDGAPATPKESTPTTDSNSKDAGDAKNAGDAKDKSKSKGAKKDK